MYKKINRVHLEVTSRCNARCPQCLRNHYGTEHIKPGLQETELSLETLKTIFADDNLKNLHAVLINGNYGDIIMHSSPLQIVRFFREKYPDNELLIHTNGGALKDSIWKEFAQFNPIIEFGIDGLGDTHHLYRRNTSFNTVIKNAKAFIDAGGQAEWIMNVFKHNQHQINDCKKLADELGFSKFSHRISTRGLPENATMVLDNQLNLDYLLEVSDLLPNKNSQTQSINFYKSKIDSMKKTFLDVKDGPVNEKFHNQTKNNWFKNNQEKMSLPVTCKALKGDEIYISAQGMIYPCCWLGLQRAHGHAHYHDDFVSMLEKTGVDADDFDLNKKTLTEIFEGKYFNSIFNSFTNENRLMKCSETCTSPSYYDQMALSKLENIDSST